MKKAVIILALLLAISAAYNIIYIRARVSGGEEERARPDTVRIIDTLRYVSPAPTRDTIIRYVRVPVELPPPAPDNPANPYNPANPCNSAEYAEKAAADTDTLRAMHDIASTAAVLLPITSRTYSAPEYTAYVSGYQPSLDSIAIHAPRTIITQPQPAAKSKPWGIGIAAGIGAGRGGITPFIGIALQYSLIRF